MCARVPTQAIVAGDDALCAGDECVDEFLLHGLDERIAALPPRLRARGAVIVMHPMGSHGPAYFKRSPARFKRFLPECAINILPDCSNAELVNAYDNSIVYTDHVLASTIRWLKARAASWDSALIYVADHGESLGEHNLRLHGLPYAVAPDVQKRVPWITWLAPEFERRAADARISHGHLFHSVLGLLDVTTDVYRRELDVHADCTMP